MFGSKKAPPQTESANLLLIAEFQALRAEILQCLQHTQSIVQWSLAAYGVLFGAGIVAATDGTSRTDSFLRMAVLLIFAALIPGLSFAATLNWLGEMTRMERTAVYLRGVEYELRQHPAPNLFRPSFPPLNWDVYLAGDKESRKITAPYIGIALMFLAGFLGSMFMAFTWVDVEFRELTDGTIRDSFPLWVAVVTALYVGTCLHLGSRVFMLRNRRYSLELEYDVVWPGRAGS